MKKILMVVCLITLLAAMFTGCEKTAEKGTQGKTAFKIGVTQFADHPSLDNCREGFIGGLKESGLAEGEDFVIDFQSAKTDMALQNQIVSKFVSDNVSLICGIATPTAQAAYSAALPKKIPVIFNAVSDPIAAKLAKSETENMDGITGVSDKLPVEEQLKLIRELMPNAKKIGIIYTTSEVNSISQIKTFETLAPSYGFEIISRGIAKQAEIPAAADFVLSKVDVMTNLTDNTVVSGLAAILEKADAKKIPVFGSEIEQVKNGCLATVGIDYIELGKQAGKMAARVLKGEDINTIHFETVKDFSKYVNTEKMAKLGMSVDESLLKDMTKI